MTTPAPRERATDVGPAEVAEQLALELTACANFMRGMTLDPAIPAHAKEALRSRISTVERLVADACETLGIA